MVVRSWAYGVPNWIYVVLSRVRTLQGLFICEKLKYTESFAVDPKLLQEEERLKKLEDDLIKFLESSSNNNNEDVCDESCNEINKNNDIVKKNATDYINSSIAKEFHGVIHIGVVKSFRENDYYWHVEYQDGDEEDFDFIELTKGIELFNSVNYK